MQEAQLRATVTFAERLNSLSSPKESSRTIDKPLERTATQEIIFFKLAENALYLSAYMFRAAEYVAAL